MDEFFVQVLRPTILTATIVVGTDKLDHLHIEPARCEIKHVMNYGCVGCNVKPYLIFQAYNVKHEGAI